MNTQVYTLCITREQIPLVVSFNDVRDQIKYECPVSLTAFYRPVSINSSDTQHIYSAPCIDVLTRRSKVNPLDERPLGESWKVPELNLDKEMSAAPVKCFFAYRGCKTVMKLSEVGSHAKDCPHKPSTELDTKDVTETEWYKRHFASSSHLEIETKHTLETRSWEKQLWKAIGEGSASQLCTHASEQLRLYRERLPKPGDTIQYEHGHSPLDCLEQATVHYASAFKLNPRDPQLHFLLGQALEEQYYASEMYGLKKKTEEDTQELGTAKTAGREEEILAICKLHGFSGTPTLENQLKALDMEFHQLKEQGQSVKADHIQTLFIWLSKRAGKDGRVCVSDEESLLHRALMKYLDAWSLRPDSWEYNLHVGRLLLLQGRSREALQHLQAALALRPSHPALRFYTGLAMLQQEGGLGTMEQEAVVFLQQGLEHVITNCFSPENQDRGDSRNMTDPLSTVNTQFLRGCLSLGDLLQRTKTTERSMNAEQVYHIVVVLAVQGVCRCVCRGQVAQQLEWVLLDAHFALLQILIHQEITMKQPWIAKRCQALTALIRLTTISPCRELLDLQEKVCQVGVVTTPRCSQALCLLGLAQLAQYDNDPQSERGQTALADCRLSFQASIEVEGTPKFGVAPDLLATQRWWQDQQLMVKMMETAVQRSTSPAGKTEHVGAVAPGRGVARGRGTPVRAGATAAAKASGPGRACKTSLTSKTPTPCVASRGRTGAASTAKTEVIAKSPVKSSTKTQLTPCKTKPNSCPPQTKTMVTEAFTVERPVLDNESEFPTSINCRSHSPRLGLARALSRSTETQEQACKLYQEVIAMASEVHDAYIELAELLVHSDPLAAVDVYCRFPLKPVSQQSFDDAFITGEIVHILMKHELYDHPQLGPNLIAYGKVMGLGCLEKYIDVLDGKFKTNLLKTVYAGIHDKSVEDEDLQDFFKFKCWI
ncbi:hypothetical protein MATL_G00189370 [Megalops atlanticus]|uniref:Uncharacterized protein n=1 Tax=Megalops atlanticus TaxID=7932 RepID=A0A9D3PL96_MEGAT|nr:hypothetical protein MATL_G00189370 [Megalops atlanticus]